MELGHLIAFVVVGALLAILGKGIHGMVFPKGVSKAGHPGWRGVFYMTMWVHPIIVGAIIGIPAWLPAPEMMGDHTAGRIIWFALSGGIAPTCYNAVMSVVKQRAGIRESVPPEPGA